MKKLLIVFFALLVQQGLLWAQVGKSPAEYYKIIVYHCTGDSQLAVVDNYLKEALLPVAHQAGIRNIGVFKPVTNDTVADKRIIVWMPAKDLAKLISLKVLEEKWTGQPAGRQAYQSAPYNHPPFARYETILLSAFRLAPAMSLPSLKSPRAEHIYELRSYESPTEKLFDNKVTMFNEGGEIALFRRLGFNAVFYASVISGSRMPNLMYLTSFENMAEREAHWKTFSADPEWKRLSSLPEYQHNVSRADIILMRATDYSDF